MCVVVGEDSESWGKDEGTAEWGWEAGQGGGGGVWHDGRVQSILDRGHSAHARHTRGKLVHQLNVTIVGNCSAMFFFLCTYILTMQI